ncbi:hypothetical protein POTOM_045048 [Populus tomentosa]|uniref:NB-ARC domain-containing protein n=1 Tax=Populus tomentosa TaxID=118781 RepID=A0A8X7YJ48_POPTO|nr:hypothetical protein POTOM_045048 [Populus tomentosa]
MPARILIFTEIMNALRLAGVNMVRVHGMGGMGKNTLVKEVAIEAMKNTLFDKMIIATVTQNQDIMKAQGQIADQLGLTFDEESEWGITSRLRGRISSYSCSFSIASSHDIGTSTIFCSSHSISFKGDNNCCSYASLEENFIARAIDY